MAFLNTSLLIFATVFEHTFIVHHGFNTVSESYVCFDETNTTCSSSWIRLLASYQDGLLIFRTLNLPMSDKQIINYKIKLIFPNQSFGESQWKQVLNTSFIPTDNRVSRTEVYNTTTTNATLQDHRDISVHIYFSSYVYLVLGVIVLVCLYYVRNRLMFSSNIRTHS